MNKVKVSVAEVLRITEKSATFGDIQHARDVFNQIMQNPSENVRSFGSGGLATAMFMAGYLSGVRTERAKRRDRMAGKTKPEEISYAE